MAEDDNNITKLIIYGLGISVIALFAYLIYRESDKKQMSQMAQLSSMTVSQLESIEQRLTKLEKQRTKSNYVSLSSKSDENSKPMNVVSMNDTPKSDAQIFNLTPADQTRLRKMKFGMR